jgi:response regulator RpfG family c-di-GMP phosphodiesterase
MSGRVLFVDDEPNVLAAFERQLRKRYALETAPGGAEGLAALEARGPFAVVVSDMRMPGMDGARFLALARQRFPDTVRVLLTGYADLRSAIDVVNHGGVFRFLTKPCAGDALTDALDGALAQYRLVTAERELLDRTLRGSVQVLGEVLALASPTAFEQVARVQRLVRELDGILEGAGAWEVDVAAVLSRLGCVAVPEPVLAAASRGADLAPEDRRRVQGVNAVTRNLLRPIPRLERVVAIIEGMDLPFEAPDALGGKRGDSLPLGARVLRAAFDFDTLVARGVPGPEAVSHLRARAGLYDPAVLASLETLSSRADDPEVREVSVGALAPGMVLAEDLHNSTGTLLLCRGYPITDALRYRLEAMAASEQMPDRLRVLVPPAARDRP